MFFDTLKHNKQVLERRLTKILQEMCKTIGTNLAEWDVDEELYDAIIESEHFHKLVELSVHYNQIHKLAESMGIQLNVRYSWFNNLHTESNTQNQDFNG